MWSRTENILNIPLRREKNKDMVISGWGNGRKSFLLKKKIKRMSCSATSKPNIIVKIPGAYMAFGFWLNAHR